MFQNYVLTIVTKHTGAWNNFTSDHLNFSCVFISSPSYIFPSSWKGLGRMQDNDIKGKKKLKVKKVKVQLKAKVFFFSTLLNSPHVHRFT